MPIERDLVRCNSRREYVLVTDGWVMIYIVAVSCKMSEFAECYCQAKDPTLVS